MKLKKVEKWSHKTNYNRATLVDLFLNAYVHVVCFLWVILCSALGVSLCLCLLLWIQSNPLFSTVKV
jgi:hypothetical protein